MTPRFWEAACAANPHGLGLMAHAQGQLHIRRHEVSCPSTLQSALAALPPACPVGVHLREATFGARTACNVHPHEAVLDEARALRLGMMHNGSVPDLAADATCGPSDSALLLHTVLAPALRAHPDHWSAAPVLDRLEATLPALNRLLLMDSEGQVRLIRAQEGFEYQGLWLSNRKAQAWLRL